MLLIGVIALLIWIGAGVALLRWSSKPRGSNFTRAVDRPLLPVGESVRVSLQLVPPSLPVVSEEPHDVVLMLDQSSSMGDGPGSALAGAVRAAENFVRRCPDSVRIGLIAFHGSASVLSPITSDHAAVLRSLESISAGDGTSIGAALAAAVDLIATTSAPAMRKTAILLSDGASSYHHALAQGQRLREHARIVTVAFSDSADEQLLTAIAGPTGRFCRVADVEELSELFAILASFVSAETVVAGVVEEPAAAPAPFQLAHTGTLHPIRVQDDGRTTIAWSVPVMDPRVVSLSYDLVPECPGWHSVARAGGRAVWQLPDGTQQIMTAPTGPRVLALPSWLVWSWPILNPLFWMLFGRFFCRARREVRVKPPIEQPEPLVLSTLPAPLEPPQPTLYEPRVRPALIIGLGETGEWAVTHLGHLLADRGIGRDVLSLLAIRATFEQGRERIRAGVFALDANDRIEVRQDLRPYLENLRKEVPAVRRWIPVREWLGRIGPRTTDWLHDRRQARLALLQRPVEVEERIGAEIAALKRRQVDETALVIGSAHDPECSGMLAEVAHVLAIAGAQTTAIVSAPRVPDGREADELQALANELERMLLMRGDEVLSDRDEPPASARQLLDRLVVLRGDMSAEDGTGRAIADLAWELLAYAEVLRRVPMARADENRRQVECCAVEQSVLHFPAETLWRWVRTRALSRAVNGVWLGVTVKDGEPQVPTPPADVIAKWTNAFWTASGISRPQSLLLRSGAGLIGDSPANSSAVALFGRLPGDALYVQQAEFADRERQTTAHFLEAWCQALLDEGWAQRRCALPVLLAALREIEAAVSSIQRRLRELAADQRSAAACRLALSLYSDLASYLERFRKNVEAVIATLTGNQVALDVVGPESAPLDVRIECLRRAAEADVSFPTESVRADAELRDAGWYQHYGAALLDQLRLRFSWKGKRPTILLELSGKPVEGDLLTALDSFLAPYRAEVLSWPLADALEPIAVDQPGRRFRVGAPSTRLHPAVPDPTEDADPYIAATLSVQRVSVNEAIGVRNAGVRRLPYAWPEEANAVRISALVTNTLSRRPQPFSPTAVHLLRDTNALHDFFADVAEKRISIRDGRCWLSRQGGEYFVGEAPATATPLEALANFERVVRQAALLKRSLDATAIPVREELWNVSPGDAVSLIENHQLVRPALSSMEWEMWKDVIRGVVLDVEAQRRSLYV